MQQNNLPIYIDENQEDDESRDFIEDLALNEDTERNITLGGSDWTTETITSQIQKGNINLKPRFQRRDAWSFDRKSSFIESLILGLPIPQIVLAEMKQSKGKYIVIDGKQRLLTLAQFYGIEEFTIFKLKRLGALKRLTGYTYEKIRNDPSTNDLATSFENAPIRTVVIKNWNEEAVLYDIFLRLNTGSVSLSPQELRQALHPGPFVDFSDSFASNNTYLRTIFPNRHGEADFRMRDVELFTRFVAFKLFIENYNGNYKIFLDNTCKSLNKAWDSTETEIRSLSSAFNMACETSYTIFRENTFHKWNKTNYETKFNRAVFDIMMFYFSDESISAAATLHPLKVKTAFIDLCSNDQEFLQSIERTTKSITATFTRLRTWGLALTEALPDVHVKIP